MQQLKPLEYTLGSLGELPTGFYRASAAGVNCVEIHLEIIGTTARHHWALWKMQIVKDINNARRVEKILQCAFAIVAAIRLIQIYCGPDRAI